MSYQEAKNTRREARTLVGRFRGGKLAPVMAVAVRGNEGGIVSQTVNYELDPIAGRMITPITAELISVFVPVQAIDLIKDPAASYAGMTEVIREKLLTGNPLFGLENEGEISKRCGVNPRSIGGVLKVNEMVRLAHNAAVNYLRQRKYVKATLLLHGNTALTPALISQTILERLNGVLDPEDRVNGMVEFQTGVITAPVSAAGTATFLPLQGAYIADGVQASVVMDKIDGTSDSTGNAYSLLTKRANQNSAPTTPIGVTVPAAPALNANLSGLNVGSVSLLDFYRAEKMDNLVRNMRQIVDDNPEHGEEIVLRWAHGMSTDAGKVPFVIAEKKGVFGRNIVGATDSAGINNDVMRSDMMLSLNFTVPVPRTELGGIIITFCTLKPDETLFEQPHPYLSDVWGAENFVADEMALDPVPVTMRELDSQVAQASESTVALYTGHNGLKKAYVHYGLNRHINPTTVEAKTALWQLKIPVSVTADNILYPDSLSHYPFADQNAEVCTYTITSNVSMQTPTIFGPTPVEELAEIETSDIFDEA